MFKFKNIIELFFKKKDIDLKEDLINLRNESVKLYLTMILFLIGIYFYNFTLIFLFNQSFPLLGLFLLTLTTVYFSTKRDNNFLEVFFHAIISIFYLPYLFLDYFIFKQETLILKHIVKLATQIEDQEKLGFFNKLLLRQSLTSFIFTYLLFFIILLLLFIQNILI